MLESDLSADPGDRTKRQGIQLCLAFYPRLSVALLSDKLKILSPTTTHINQPRTILITLWYHFLLN